jgi:hypothetical protein
MTEMLQSAEPASEAQCRLELAHQMTDFDQTLSIALAAGSDWVIDYRSCETNGGLPRRYLRPEVRADYLGRPALKSID